MYDFCVGLDKIWDNIYKTNISLIKAQFFSNAQIQKGLRKTHEPKHTRSNKKIGRVKCLKKYTLDQKLKNLYSIFF